MFGTTALLGFNCGDAMSKGIEKSGNCDVEFGHDCECELHLINMQDSKEESIEVGGTS